ncbi:MAG: HEAT repeat domain-containing protein [Actinobacteria bacterium]|nr:HEAT repeat domain-containing protein [Actinomycetota bacterium]
MRRLALALTLALALDAGAARAGANAQVMAERLAQGPDFRVRVQAALELGKLPGDASRVALERALDDENAAVRAAAAAGLKVLGDARATAALEAHRSDPSAPVRAQITTTLAALRAAPASTPGAAPPSVLVQLGKIRSSAPATSGRVLDAVERVSREQLVELPGVALTGDGPVPASRRNLPVVMLTGRVKQLEESRVGGNVVYSASIEFVLHKMPGQAIKGVVSGSARATGSVAEAADSRAREDLLRSALEAAVASAVKRAPLALRAAME